MILPHGANTIVLLVACAKDIDYMGPNYTAYNPWSPHIDVYVIPLVDDNTFYNITYDKALHSFRPLDLKSARGAPDTRLWIKKVLTDLLTIS